MVGMVKVIRGCHTPAGWDVWVETWERRWGQTVQNVYPLVLGRVNWRWGPEATVEDCLPLAAEILESCTGHVGRAVEWAERFAGAFLVHWRCRWTISSDTVCQWMERQEQRGREDTVCRLLVGEEEPWPSDSG